MSEPLTRDARDQLTRDHHFRLLWTRFGTIFLGLWLLVAPVTFGYVERSLIISDMISGALLIFFGLISMSYPLRAWIWGGCFVGIWLQFAPLAFWAQEPVIYVNDTLIGALAIAFCVLVPLRPKEFEIGPSIPPGWTYNPSAWTQRIPVILLATICWFLARYMASYQLHYIHTIWDPFFGLGTQKVITSMISQEFPVPDAGLGALVYSLEAIMGAKGGVKRWHTMPWLVVIFGILVVPAGFVSILLIMIQPIAVGAWCGICLLTAVCMLIMLALSVDEVLAVLQFLNARKKEGQSVWRVFWYGSRYEVDGVDTRTPHLKNSSLSRNVASMFWGITIPWNLVLTALIGVWILFTPYVFHVTGVLADNIDVVGALVTTFSIIAFAEVIRPVRFINWILAFWLGFSSFILAGSFDPGMRVSNLVAAALVFVLTIPKGKVKEKYGTWDAKIH